MTLNTNPSSLALGSSLAEAIAAIAADRHLDHDEAQQLVVMGERLQHQGLARWCCALLAVFGRYRGLEQYIAPGQGTIPQILAWLDQRTPEPKAMTDIEIAGELAQLDFTFYRVRASGKLWDVTRCSLLHFAGDAPLSVWESDQPYPSREGLQAFLMGQLEQPSRA